VTHRIAATPELIELLKYWQARSINLDDCDTIWIEGDFYRLLKALQVAELVGLIDNSGLSLACPHCDNGRLGCDECGEVCECQGHECTACDGMGTAKHSGCVAFDAEVANKVRCWEPEQER
jgi:hypothetical protein